MCRQQPRRRDQISSVLLLSCRLVTFNLPHAVLYRACHDRTSAALEPLQLLPLHARSKQTPADLQHASRGRHTLLLQLQLVPISQVQLLFFTQLKRVRGGSGADNSCSCVSRETNQHVKKKNTWKIINQPCVVLQREQQSMAVCL